MSSRENILASIRQHTQTRYDKPDTADIKRLSYPNKIEQFCAISHVVGGTAAVLGEGEDVNAVIRRTYPDAIRIASVLPDISYTTFNPDNLDGLKELDGTDITVVKGGIGVAESGAIQIPQAVKYKIVYFISEKLVILLDRNKIIDTMYDAYHELDGQKYQFGTFISGPSKTADIEQAPVMGTYRIRDVLVILTQCFSVDYSKINLVSKQWSSIFVSTNEAGALLTL